RVVRDQVTAPFMLLHGKSPEPLHTAIGKTTSSHTPVFGRRWRERWLNVGAAARSSSKQPMKASSVGVVQALYGSVGESTMAAPTTFEELHEFSLGGLLHQILRLLQLTAPALESLRRLIEIALLLSRQTLLCVIIFAGSVQRLCRAQDLAPRAYFITPLRSNAITVSESFFDGSIDYNGVIPINDATGTYNIPLLSYYHSFDFFGRSANVVASLPYGVGNFRGTVGTEMQVYRSGLLDSIYRVSVKPELGYSQAWGKWVLDAYSGVWFFTENSEFFSRNPTYPGTRSQSQKPIAAFEGHLSYDVKPRLWLSLDGNYWFGGKASLDGVENSLTQQANSRVGATVSVPISKHQSLKLSYSDGAYIRFGGNYQNVSVAWQYSWLGRPN